MSRTSDRIREARRQFVKDMSVAEAKDIVNPMLDEEDEIVLSEVLPDPDADAEVEGDGEEDSNDVGRVGGEVSEQGDESLDDDGALSEEELDELFGGDDEDDWSDYDDFADENDEGNGDTEDDLDDEDEGENNYDDYFTSSEDDEFGGFNLDRVLTKGLELGASDVHISADDVVAYTVLGKIVKVDEFGIVDPNILTRLSQSIIPHVMEQEFVEELELDTYYILREGPYKGRRCRLSIGKSFGNPFMVFRIIADQMPFPEELGLEKEIIEWSTLPNGLILINGPTGTGKSTLISSLIKNIQYNTEEKIITIEKPIEFVYGIDGPARITQREVGRDSRSFAKALDGAMRQAPDRIVVGEVRNEVEVDALIRAAESGHWAISTIHASSSPVAINRIMSLFEGPELRRVLGSLADNIRGMANQVLLKAPDGKSRFGVREVLSINEELAGYIRDGRTDLIRKYQIDNGITMEHALAETVREGLATKSEARSKAGFPSFFDKLVEDLPELVVVEKEIEEPIDETEGEASDLLEVDEDEKGKGRSDSVDSEFSEDELNDGLDDSRSEEDKYIKAERVQGKENPFINTDVDELA